MKIAAGSSVADDLAWLVDNRSRNQKQSIDLYNLLSEHKEKLEENRRYRAFFHILVGVNFSMWRAVFLSDLEQEKGSMLARSEEFLEELIRNNAINYPQDRKYRDYSFRYYIQNAKSRLEDLSKSFAYYNASFEVPGASRGKLPREWWLMHQEAAEAAMASLRTILRQAKPARRSKGSV